jgi:hypothetical protein
MKSPTHRLHNTQSGNQLRTLFSIILQFNNQSNPSGKVQNELSEDHLHKLEQTNRKWSRKDSGKCFELACIAIHERNGIDGHGEASK